MAQHNELGKWGEEQAVKYLLANGYTIVERNWRVHPYEIDLIALKDQLLVVVEVKTRQSNNYGEPESFVSNQQIQHLLNAINFFLEGRSWDYEVRFDIISICKLPTLKLNHIENAFTA